MRKVAIVLAASSLAGCAGLDGVGPGGGFASGFSGGYGPPPSGYYAPSPYYEPPAYYGGPAFVYERRGRDGYNDRSYNGGGQGYGGGGPGWGQQRQQAIVQQQQQFNQSVAAAQQRYNQQVTANPQATPYFREQLSRDAQAARQQLEQNTRGLR